ncbi:MAG: Gfo/Idh/MocA family protein, partial [Planctomycetia bacterium]
MTSSIRIGLIGQKFMGRAHSNAWGQVNRFFDLQRRAELHTIAARNGAELAAFAERWGWKHRSTDWKSLAKDPDLDLVDIGTSNDVHAEQAIAMLEGGKHVACEKPLAGTLDDARTMRDAAKRRKKQHTFVWYNYRRCPAVALAWQLMREGCIGRVYHVRAQYLQSWGGPDTPLLWRFQKKSAGSGAHGDLNAHIIDMARFITGEEVTEVVGAVEETFVKERDLVEGSGGAISGTGAKRAASRGRRKGRSTVDDAVLFLARMSGGAVA